MSVEYDAENDDWGDNSDQVNVIITPKTCGLCETILDNDDNIAAHSCLEGYARYSIDTNNYFYPLCDDNTIVMKSMMPNGKEAIVQAKMNFQRGGGVDENIANNNLPDSELQMSSSNDDTFVEKLILYVYAREPLWNIRSKYNKRSTASKEALWEEISQSFSDKPPIDFLKSKWRNLCTQFYRVLKKQQGKSGQAASKKSKWPYFEAMSFLQNVNLENQETCCNAVSSQSSLDTNVPPDEMLASLSNFQDISPLEEVIGDINDGLDHSSAGFCKTSRQNKNANLQLQAAEKLANAIQASTPIINFPSIPALPPPPPATEASAFAHLIEAKLNSIENVDDRQEVIDNTFLFVTSEIRRVRGRRLNTSTEKA